MRIEDEEIGPHPCPLPEYRAREEGFWKLASGPALRTVTLSLLAFPTALVAGDSPYIKIRDWGVGKIDNHVMFYVGKDRYLDTPIPSPPEGPRWDHVYGVTPLVVAAMGLTWALLRRYRCRCEQDQA